MPVDQGVLTGKKKAKPQKKTEIREIDALPVSKELKKRWFYRVAAIEIGSGRWLMSLGPHDGVQRGLKRWSFELFPSRHSAQQATNRRSKDGQETHTFLAQSARQKRHRFERPHVGIVQEPGHFGCEPRQSFCGPPRPVARDPLGQAIRYDTADPGLLVAGVPSHGRLE
jgi:hypothetical protein